MRGRTASPPRPAETRSYRADRMVADVEALREHLGYERIDLAAICFPNARVVVQRRAGHYPWIDDPAEFLQLIAEG